MNSTICVVDFDGTYFKNDYFKECFLRVLITRPWVLINHFILKRRSLLALKHELLESLAIPYDPSNMMNHSVNEWIQTNRHHYDKIVLVSASPHFFVKKLLQSSNVFDEVYGSTSINLKGKAKWQFIEEKFGNQVDYIGDSKADEYIFKQVNNGIRVKSISPRSFVLQPLLKLIRPNNWIKNGLIFLPFLLAGKFQLAVLLQLCLGLLAFSFISSASYILNDLHDIEHDRSHPFKMKRPLAAGSINIDLSFFTAIFLIGLALLISYYLGWVAMGFLIFYFFQNLLYSVFIKTIRFIDIICLSSFYLVRVFYGASISNTPLTGWFIATLTMAVLSIAINKRYLECLIAPDTKINGRGYKKNDALMLQPLMYNFAFAAMVLLNVHAYFVLTIHSPYFYGLINLAAAAILFFYFDNDGSKSDDPIERIVKNKPLLVAAIFFFIIYINAFIQRS
jgi:4-hydroxybenzoate polyprenyltransferase